jgi:hypothetical protein
MKKLILVLVFALMLPGVMADVWGDCPFGEVDDTYPGNCGSYVDSNGDSICDYSQPEPGSDIILVKEDSHSEEEGHLSCGSMRGMRVSEIADFYGLDADNYASTLSDLAKGEVKVTDVFGDLETKYGITTDGGKGIAVLMKEGKYATETESTTAPVISSSAQLVSLLDRYNVIPITIILLLAMVLSEVLIKNKLVVRYFWNVVLLISFFAAAITSLIYFFRLEGLHALVVTLHIQLGLVAVWVGFYHVLKMYKYYVRGFPWKK